MNVTISPAPDPVPVVVVQTTFLFFTSSGPVPATRAEAPVASLLLAAFKPRIARGLATLLKRCRIHHQDGHRQAVATAQCA